MAALVGVCPKAIFAPFSLGQAGHLYECGGGYFNKEKAVQFARPLGIQLADLNYFSGLLLCCQ